MGCGDAWWRAIPLALKMARGPTGKMPDQAGHDRGNAGLGHDAPPLEPPAEAEVAEPGAGGEEGEFGEAVEVVAGPAEGDGG